MKKLTHTQVKNVKDKIAESLGRGNGAILFRRKKEGAPVFAFYRYFRGNTPVTIAIVQYEASLGKDDAGRKLVANLEYCRNEAYRLMHLRHQIKPVDLKEYLEQEELRKTREHDQSKRQAEIDASRGSLSELIQSYVQSLHAAGKASAKETGRALEREVISAHKALADTRAREITAEDIRQILRPVYLRGSRVMGNRLRSYLLAAFSFGLDTDLDPERENEKVFCLEYNPVASIKPKRDAESVGERSLTHEEIHQLWNSIGSTPKVGPLMALFVQFLFAVGGQRPKQVLACKWSDYDLKNGTLTIINTKGKTQRPVRHVVPLTLRARGILNKVRERTQDYDWPFTSRGTAPFSIDSVNTAISRYVAFNETEHFSPRDIRRTVKNLMIDAGVNREQRNLIQGHGQTGIDIKHYERHDQLADKRAAMAIYARLLDSILSMKKSNQECATQATSLVKCWEA